MGTLYIGLFIRRLDSIVKKKKLPGWWSIEARPRPANRRKEETIAAGVDVKFMTGCKHGNSLSLSLPRSFYHSFQILPSDSHRQIAPRGTGEGRKKRGNARVELIETESVELPAHTYKEGGERGGKVIRYKTLEKNRTFSTIPRGLFPTTRAH